MRSPGRTRQEIIETSAKLFARYGFRKTSIDDVAAAARIGKGSVYLHFGSKDELFGAVVRLVSDRTLESLVAAVQRARSPDRKLRAFVEAKLESVAHVAEGYHLDEETLMELLREASIHRRGHDAREHELLATVLRGGIASGAFAVEQPDAVATGMLALLTSLLTSTVVKHEDAEIRAGVDEVVELLVRGLAHVSAERLPADQTDRGVARATPDEE